MARQMTMVLRTITPAQAKDMLERNAVNRPLRSRNVSMYARDMRESRWMITGDPIVFDTKGYLIDGQHRLNACVSAGKSFKSWVAENADEGVQDVKDTGARRTLSDVLHMRGEVSPVLLASILRAVAVQEEDYEMKSGFYTPTNPKKLDLFNSDVAKYREAVQVAGRMYQSTRMGSATMWGLLWLRLSAVDEDDAEDFFDRIRTAANIAPGDAVYVLRRALSNMEISGSLAARRKMFALVVKAWNAYRGGTSVQTLAFKSGGRSPERMPSPK